MRPSSIDLQLVTRRIIREALHSDYGAAPTAKELVTDAETVLPRIVRSAFGTLELFPVACFGRGLLAGHVPSIDPKL